jgi:simple sugar transport system permease protein
MMITGIASLGLATLVSAAPLALAALGGLATEAACSLSIGLEGAMLVGAFSSAAVGATAGLGGGLASGTAAGAALCLLAGAAAIGLGADVFVAGLAANLLAPGIVSVISQAAFGTKGVLPAPAIRAGQGLILLVLVLAIILLVIILAKSVFGLRLRAAGEGGEVAEAAGIHGSRYRLSAHLIAGASAGLAGACLASGIGAYAPGMTTGRGWIALVAVFLGARRCSGVIAASLLLGLLFALSNIAQGFWSGASGAELVQALPYAATAFAFVAWGLGDFRKRGRT